MAIDYRIATKCANCGSVLWFGPPEDDPSHGPQFAKCSCGETSLTEAGPSGNWTWATSQDVEDNP